MSLPSIGAGCTIRFCRMPLARMLASSSASSAAVAGVLRTFAGDRTSWLRQMLVTLLGAGAGAASGCGAGRAIRRAADFLVMVGDSLDGQARAVSRPGKPVTNPLSALF